MARFLRPGFPFVVLFAIYAASSAIGADKLPGTLSRANLLDDLLRPVPAAPPSAPQTPEQLRARYELDRGMAAGMQLLKSDANERAIQLLSETLKNAEQAGIIDDVRRYQLHGCLGVAAHQLKRFDDATNHMASAQEAAERAYGRASREAAGMIGCASKTKLDHGNLDEADRLVCEALERLDKAPNAQPGDRIIPLQTAAAVAAQRNDPATAEARLREACEIRTAEDGVDSVSHADGLLLLGILQANREDYPAARASLDQVAAIYEKHYGPDDRRTQDARKRLADVVRKINPNSPSNEEQRLAAELQRLIGEISALRDKKDYQAALPLVERALKLIRQMTSERDRSFSLFLFFASQVYGDLKRYQEEAGLLEESLAIYEKLPKQEPQELLLLVSAFGRAQQRAGNHDEARTAFLRVMQLAPELGPETDRALFDTFVRLLALDHAAKDYNALLKHADQATAVFERREDNEALIRLLSNISLACLNVP